jgi:hypothetical protein
MRERLRNAQNILGPSGKKELGRHKHKWEDINMFIPKYSAAGLPLTPSIF